MPADGCECSRFGERADATHCLYALRTGWRFDACELFCRNGLDGQAEFARQRDQQPVHQPCRCGRQRVEPASAAGRNQRFAQRIDVCFSFESRGRQPSFHRAPLHAGRTASQDLKPPSGAACAISTASVLRRDGAATRITAPRFPASPHARPGAFVSERATRRRRTLRHQDRHRRTPPAAGAESGQRRRCAPHATSILFAQSEGCGRWRGYWPRDRRVVRSRPAVPSHSAHSTETEPEPAPISIIARPPLAPAPTAQAHASAAW